MASTGSRRCVVALAAALLVGSVAIASRPAQATTPARLDPLLAAALATAAPTDTLMVIGALPAVPSAATLAALRAAGVQATGYRQLPFVAMLGTPAAIAAVRPLAGMSSLWLDHTLESTLHESVALIGADRAHSQLGVDGTGVTVAVLDSGIDGNHPDLAYPTKTVQNVKVLGDQHVLPSPTFTVEGVTDTDTTTGHGTHVAGIVAGTGAASNGYYAGVAPGAKLVGVGAADGLDMLTALAGYDWILEHRVQYGIRVVNNSWADGTIVYDPADPLNQASKAAHDAGVTVVFAAGNDGQTGGNVYNRYAWPAWVIGVGGSTKLATLGDYSSRGDADHHPSVIAPGSFIASTRALTGVVNDANSSPLDLTDPANPRFIDPTLTASYTAAIGTSMAAPHVAGVVALVLQAAPSLTPDQVAQAIVSSARPVAGCAVVDCGAGLVDAYGAVLAGRRIADKPPVARLTASATSGAAPLAVTLSAAASTDADGRVVSYSWDTDGDGAVDATTTAATLAHTYPAGRWRPTVTAVDDLGVASAPVGIDLVSSTPPKASATAPAKASRGSTVTFDATASTDADGHVVSYRFRFGDGVEVTSTTPTVTHAYANRATFAWSVTVTDDAGLTDGTSHSIKVT